MGSGPSAHLHVGGSTPLHRLPPHAKLVGLVTFVLLVVSVPRAAPARPARAAPRGGRRARWSTRVPARHLLPRLAVELPFAVFALLLPFVALGPQVPVGPFTVSQDGLDAAVALLLKGTCGVALAVAFAVTTRPRDLVRALQHLRVPDTLVTIAGFMVRYVDVVGDQMRRMRVARASRGFSARSLRAWPALAAGTGALFIRSYERGERVHLAMVSRGWAGRMPVTAPLVASPRPVGPGAGARGPRRRPDAGGAARMSVPVLDLRGVAYAYPGGHQALFGVDLHVHPGERVALLGPNGAGKTTLVLHLNGILPPGAGTVTVSGLPVTDAHLLEVRRRVGIVFQDPDDQLFMPTVRDDVAFGPANLGLRGAELEARVSEALDLVGVGDLADRAPHHLSFGQRRRVAIATVLAMRPEILVLDEPSSNLDPASRRELAGILRSLDVTVLMVTHDLPYAVELCERAVVLSEGTVVADGADARGARRRDADGAPPPGAARGVLDLGWCPCQQPSSTRPSASSPGPSGRPAAAPSSSRRAARGASSRSPSRRSR